MNPADLPPELAAQPADLIDAVRAIAQGPLASQAYAIDRGAYPVDVMKQLAAEHMTMLIVTHEMRFAGEVADRIVFMDGGVVVEEGAPHEILQNPVQERTRSFLKKHLHR